MLILASVMFSKHHNSERWYLKALELQVSAYATPSDKLLKKTINGIKLNKFLKGSNLEENGTVINHDRVHVDYMVAVVGNATNVFPYSLIGESALKTSVFNANRIYEALLNLPFNEKTMYIRDEGGKATANVYFPEGNDWGTGNQANYWLMDVVAYCFHLDKKVNPKAIDWMHVRGEEMKKKQSRNANGTYYADVKENTYPTCEETFLAEIAFGYLFLWMNEHQMVHLTNRRH